MRLLISIAFVFSNILISFSQCSMCKATLETDDTPVGNSINEGILFLMPIPYIIMSVIAFILYKKFKSNQHTTNE